MPILRATYPAKQLSRVGTSHQHGRKLSALSQSGSWVLLFPLLFLLLESTSSFLVGANAGYGGVGQEMTFVQANVVPLPVRIVTAVVWLVSGIATLTLLRDVFRLAWQVKAVTALALLTVASCAWSDDPRLSLLKSALFVAGTLFAYYLSERFRPNDLMELMVVLAIIAVGASIVVCVVMPEIGIDIAGAWRGIFNHKNKLSRAILLLLPAMLNWKAVGPRHYLRACFVVAALFLTLETRSRTGWLITIGYLLLHLMLRYSRRVRTADAVALGVLLVGSSLLLCAIVLTNFAEITRALGKDPTLSGRTSIWYAAILTGMNQPALGFGFGSFWRGIQGKSINVYFATGYALWQGHNAYLDIWLDLGFAGLGLFAATVIFAVRDALICFRSKRVQEVNWYVETIFIILCLGLTQGQLVIHNSLAILLYFICCIGLRKLRLGESGIENAPDLFETRRSLGKDMALDIARS